MSSGGPPIVVVRASEEGGPFYGVEQAFSLVEGEAVTRLASTVEWIIRQGAAVDWDLTGPLVEWSAHTIRPLVGSTGGHVMPT